MTSFPQVSGKETIKVLEHIGFQTVSQRGSHVKLVRIMGNQKQTVIVPLHKTLKRGTLKNGILKPINLSLNEFKSLL